MDSPVYKNGDLVYYHWDNPNGKNMVFPECGMVVDSIGDTCWVRESVGVDWFDGHGVNYILCCNLRKVEIE